MHGEIPSVNPTEADEPKRSETKLVLDPQVLADYIEHGDSEADLKLIGGVNPDTEPDDGENMTEEAIEQWNGLLAKYVTSKEPDEITDEMKERYLKLQGAIRNHQFTTNTSEYPGEERAAA